MKPLTIDQVARQAGAGVVTVRFCEREGLLEEPQRKASGYWQFDEQAVDRIRFIRRAQELSFTLKEIKELLQLRLDPATTCADVKSRAEAKIEDVKENIRFRQSSSPDTSSVRDDSEIRKQKTCTGA